MGEQREPEPRNSGYDLKKRIGNTLLGLAMFFDAALIAGGVAMVTDRLQDAPVSAAGTETGGQSSTDDDKVPSPRDVLVYPIQRQLVIAEERFGENVAGWGSIGIGLAGAAALSVAAANATKR